MSQEDRLLFSTQSSTDLSRGLDKPGRVALPEEAEPTPEIDRRTSYQPMILILAAMLVGVVCDRGLAPPIWILLGGSAGLLIIWCLTCGLVKRSLTTRFFANWLMLGAVALAAASWHHGAWNLFGADELGRFAGNGSVPCSLEAILISEPRRVGLESDRFGELEVERQTRFAIRVTRLRDGANWRSISGRSELVVHADAMHLRSGDRVRVFGKLVGVSPATNPGQFDFREFFRAKRKLAMVHAYHAHSVRRIEGSSWQTTRWISSLRRQLNELTWTFVGERQAPFASAILLGNREQLARERRDRFVETGTVHLLAISGLHVGILAGAFLVLLRLPFFRRQTCLWLTIGFVVFYAWLVEFRPPATRASILIVLFCVGRLLGERSFSMNLLAAAAILVILLNPADVFAIGPQLSFLAVATLALGQEWVFWKPSADPIDRLIANTRSKPVKLIHWTGRQLRTAILVSTSIWLLAMPLVANRFHLVSLSGLIINPFLLVPIALALYSGLGMLLSGWTLPWLPWLARWLGWICDCHLAMVEWSVAQAHSIPWGHRWTSGPSDFAVEVFYLGAFFAAAFPATRLRGRWLVTLFVGWLVLGWWLPSKLQQAGRVDRPLRCTFLDVGHGCSVIVEQPNGETWLYDAGALGAANYGAKNIASALWNEGIDQIDVLIISHADADHFNAVPELMSQFSIGRVLISSRMASSESPPVRALLQAFQSQGVRCETVRQGDQFGIGRGGVARVLGPPESGFGENDNSDSLVFHLQSEGRHVLLPGDLERGGLRFLLSQPEVDFDVVLAPHHGSPHSNPSGLVHWSKPEFVVISGGAQRISHPMRAAFQAGGSHRWVGRTDEQGAIRMTLTREGVVGEHWRLGRWLSLEEGE